MLKPNPIIEREVRIQAISVLSAAIIVRCRARSVRASARTVPLSLGSVSTRLMEPFLKCARSESAGAGLDTPTSSGNAACFMSPNPNPNLHEPRSRVRARAGGGRGDRHDRRPVLPDSQHAKDERDQHGDQRDRKEGEAFDLL